MGYKIRMEDVLLPTWKTYDGNGVNDVPARDFNHGKLRGCIILNGEGIVVYDRYLHNLIKDDVDMFRHVLAHVSEPGDMFQLEKYLSPKLIVETLKVYAAYCEREKSFEADERESK